MSRRKPDPLRKRQVDQLTQSAAVHESESGLLEWFPGRKDGGVRRILSLQANSHRRRPLKSARRGQVIAFDYELLVPHFFQPYRSFATLDELEVTTMASTYLLSLVINDIERVLLTNLQKN